MMHYPKKAALPLLAIFLLCSCTDTKTPEETIQISTMDSTSKVLKQQTDKLDEQTKLLEASLEKMEKEFETNKK